MVNIKKDRDGRRHCKGCDCWKPLKAFQKYKTKAGNELRRKQCIKCRSRSKKSIELRRKYYEIAKVERIKLKSEIVDYLGGVCNICGNKYPDCVYDFHHIHKKEKKYNIGTMLLYYKQREKIFNELKKCIMVCSNCHRIIHFNRGDEDN